MSETELLIKERDLYAAGELYDAKNIFGDWLVFFHLFCCQSESLLSIPSKSSLRASGITNFNYD